MPGDQRPIDHQAVQLDGQRYVILRESVFRQLCRQAGVSSPSPAPAGEPLDRRLEIDRMSLAERLVDRRRAAGLSQVALARRAGIRPETLNRVERGKTTPDFTTVRKLVGAMNATERLLERWKATGLSQTDVARRAGLQPDTILQFEQGRATPDFATLRKLVVAIHAAEQEREN
jgi:transcriptional regulator with XRE-family HTH domain